MQAGCSLQSELGPLFGFRSTSPVSYTHLDVYKRQSDYLVKCRQCVYINFILSDVPRFLLKRIYLVFARNKINVATTKGICQILILCFAIRANDFLSACLRERIRLYNKSLGNK